MQRLHMAATVLAGAAAVLCGCGGGDGGADARRFPDASPFGTISGTIYEPGSVALAGATVATVGLDDAFSTTTDAAGAFSLDVPRSTRLTLSMAAPLHATTFTQPIEIAADLEDTAFPIFTDEQYDSITAMVPGSGTGAVLLVGVRTMGDCPLAGSHLGTSPSSGTTLYLGEDGTIDGTLTAATSNGGGFIVGVTGTVTPTIDVPGFCSQYDYPVVDGGVTVHGEIDTQPGVYYTRVYATRP
jgi:hypothetical protein